MGLLQSILQLMLCAHYYPVSPTPCALPSLFLPTLRYYLTKTPFHPPGLHLPELTSHLSPMPLPHHPLGGIGFFRATLVACPCRNMLSH